MTASRYGEQSLKRAYGMTYDDLQAMIDAQQNRCAICTREMARPYIDHDHDTMVVRALLCCGCNTRLGAIENAAYLTAALAYLTYHRTHTSLHRFKANPKIQQSITATKIRERAQRNA